MDAAAREGMPVLGEKARGADHSTARTRWRRNADAARPAAPASAQSRANVAASDLLGPVPAMTLQHQAFRSDTTGTGDLGDPHVCDDTGGGFGIGWKVSAGPT